MVATPTLPLVELSAITTTKLGIQTALITGTFILIKEPIRNRGIFYMTSILNKYRIQDVLVYCQFYMTMGILYT